MKLSPRVLSSVILSSAIICLAANPIHAARPDGTRGRRVSPLTQILDKLNDLQADINDLRTDVDEVKREVITCTIAQKRAGNCDRVPATTVEACFKLDLLEVALGAEWKAKVKARAEGGVAWTNGPDGEVNLEINLPVGPLPDEFGIEAAGKAGVGGDICIAIPIELIPSLPLAATRSKSRPGLRTAAIAEDQFDALADQFEQLGSTLLPMVIDQMQNDMPSGNQLRSGFETAQRLANGEMMQTGGDTLSDPMALEIVQSLPAPGMVRTGILDPGSMSGFLPELGGSGVGDRIDSFCDPNGALPLMRFPLTSNLTERLCTTLEVIPQFDVIAAAILDIPEAVAGVVDNLVNIGGDVVMNTGNLFCNLPVIRNTRVCR
jgi:hypothetical protein